MEMDEHLGEPYEDDHIWPEKEGGPDKKDAPWNHRDIPRSQNRRKSAHMPGISDVFDSDDPIKLSVEIDRASIENHGKWEHNQNKDRGFGGLPRH